MKFASLFCLAYFFAFAKANIGSISQIGNKLPGEIAGDQFAYDVAISGNGLLVASGSYFHDGLTEDTEDIGKVNVYEYSNSNNDWVPKGSPILGQELKDQLGKSLDFNTDGSMLAIGGHKMRAQVYSWENGDWAQKGTDLNTGSSANPTIYSIALSDDGLTVAVGMVGGVGKVTILQWNEGLGDWEQMGSVITGEETGKQFGSSVALNGNGSVVAIGTRKSDTAAVYQFIADDWVKMGQSITAVTAGDMTGHSVALSCSGMILAVGGYDQGGNARVFTYIGGSWVPRGTALTHPNKKLGRSVSLSSDGAILGVTGDRITAAYQWNAGSSSYDIIDQKILAAKFGRTGDMSKNGRRIVAGWHKDTPENFGAAEIYSISGDSLQDYEASGACFVPKDDDESRDESNNDSSANGDPHFSTWTNEHFEYHGQCDLIMAKDPFFADNLGLDVHIRTKIVRFWSYIQSVAIRIGNDVLEIEGSSDVTDSEAHYWKNFEYQGDLQELAGFPVTQSVPVPFKRTYKIDLSSKYEGHYILVQMYKEFIKVQFHGGEAAFGKTIGLLGDYHTGQTLARDGATELHDFAEFGTNGKSFHPMANCSTK